MRWIDIILPEPGINQELDRRLEAAAAATGQVPAIQERDGLDAVTVAQQFAEVGRLLFQAVIAVLPDAFSPDQAASAVETPILDEPAHDRLRGYHLVVDGAWVGLPWTWLHNGLGFLLEKHPLCVASRGSRLPAGPESRPWMQRLVRSCYLVGDDGGRGLRAVLPQLRPSGTLPPEMLFVLGHTDRQRRRLIHREAEAITSALAAACPGAPLVHTELPTAAVTPSGLCGQGVAYQVLHFAGPTSQPARSDDSAGEYWMNRLIAETAASRDQDIEQALGLEGEVLGVDPITSLLDDVATRYARRGADETLAQPAHSRRRARSAGKAGRSGTQTWLLDDGPVDPESLGHSSPLPPLVFSNSYRALPELGRRFVAAGASTFVGPQAPLFSRPARLFASRFYQAMGEGWCAGAALWRASAACRQELGERHPAWLSYGLQGFGSLALQYL